MSKATYTKHTEMTVEELSAEFVWKQIVRKAWSDPNFKKALQQDPKAVLEDNGFPIPDGVTSVKIVEEGAGEKVIVLPSQPTGQDLSIDTVDSALSDHNYGF
jgi:hypothetical protein